MFTVRRPAVAALVAAFALAASATRADSQAGNDRAAAQALIDSISKDSPRATVAREPLARATKALARASEASAAGDHRHASRLEAVARKWAETARDLARAAEAERQAEQLERRAHELESKLIRARALVEETVARRGRAEQTLQQLGQGAAPPAAPPSSGTKK